MRGRIVGTFHKWCLLFVCHNVRLALENCTEMAFVFGFQAALKQVCNGSIYWKVGVVRFVCVCTRWRAVCDTRYTNM